MLCRRRGALPYFYPRPPRGGRHTRTSSDAGSLRFLSTPSARRATTSGRTSTTASTNFYPRPPRGGRLTVGDPSGPESEFLSTPSARRATHHPRLRSGGQKISIHALREEGDGILRDDPAGASQFLSTPSARRATFLTGYRPAEGHHFYPRPPRGGRRNSSLHSLPEQVFLSTPSARRATPARSTSSTSWSYFYPRPPRGGRRAVLVESVIFTKISIHALREEGDTAALIPSARIPTFLSTPSARRATSS